MIQLVAARNGAFIATALRAQLGLTSDQSISSSRERWYYKKLAEGNWVISEALDIIQDHLENTLTVGQIAEVMAVSFKQLERSFSETLQRSHYRFIDLYVWTKLKNFLCKHNFQYQKFLLRAGF